MIGHSVSTLKLNRLFGRTFDGVSGRSVVAGDIGRGDVASNAFGPG
jgi:hypothetical protein